MRTIRYLVLFLFLVTTSVFAGDIKGTVKVKGVKHSGDVVIYIDKVEGKVFKAPEEHGVVDQLNLVFIPHVLPVLIGTTVDFLNSDDVLHNVFSPDYPGGKFNLGTWAKGVVKSYTFSSPGSAVLLCNVHPEMEAYVVAVKTPYFAVSEKDGSYVIKNVPEGKYTLKVWHEKRVGKPQEIEVSAKGETTVDFTLDKK